PPPPVVAQSTPRSMGSCLARAFTPAKRGLLHAATPRKVGGALLPGRGRCAPRRQSLLRSCLAAHSARRAALRGRPHSFPRRPPATCCPRSERVAIANSRTL